MQKKNRVYISIRFLVASQGQIRHNLFSRVADVYSRSCILAVTYRNQ